MSEPRGAESVAARLRFLRSTLGLSQEQLARRLGVSFATVNRWESGRTQLSPRALAAVAGLEAEVGRSDPLPVARSTFVGRERELAELSRLIRESRLVTLIGPGGAGKTRLAAEVLARDFAGADVVFVQLEQIRYPRTLVTALASRLQVHDQQGTPLTESLQAALTASPRLLLLDGAERLADQVAELAADLLGSVPELRIVVTSRVVLGVPGEICWTVPPLDCPSVAAGAADIAASDAVQLFIARASERLPDFRAADVAPHAIAELCRRLDGLPLAIELIAGWVGTLSIREILQQRAVLLDADPAGSGQHGGRRLADVLQVSYDLLSPEQQRRLAMLSVFAGSFRIDDVQAVLGLDAPAAVATLRLLVDSSWLVVARGGEQNQFSMLETIRTFAALQLEKTGDSPAVRQRHALHWAAIAAGSEQGLAGPDAADWTSRLEAAVADLHVALYWADERADIDLGLDISASLWRWWLVSGRLAVGRNWLARFLTLAGPRTDERAGRALCSAAVLAAENGDYAEAIRTAELAIGIFGPLGLKQRMALAATVLGSANRYLGHHEAARAGFQAAMDLRAELGDRRGMSVAINNMALLELDDGNVARAQELFEQSLAIKREFGEQRSIAIGLANLADVLIRSAQWDAADDVLREGAALAGGNPQLIGIIRCNQGALAAHRRNWAQAQEHYRAAIAAFQSGGHPHDVVEAMIGLGRVCHQAGQQDEAVRQLRGALTLATDIGNAQRLTDARAALAEITGEPAADSAASGAAVTEAGAGATGAGATGAGATGAGATGAGATGAGATGAGATGAGATDTGATDTGATGAGAGIAASPAAGSRPRPAGLTSRQTEVLQLLAAGLSNKQIAAELYLSPATVERHLATIYRNLGLAGRVEAARFAIENGLAGPVPPAAGRSGR